jgi:hypothetical protein
MLTALVFVFALSGSFHDPSFFVQQDLEYYSLVPQVRAYSAKTVSGIESDDFRLYLGIEHSLGRVSTDSFAITHVNTPFFFATGSKSFYAVLGGQGSHQYFAAAQIQFQTEYAGTVLSSKWDRRSPFYGQIALDTFPASSPHIALDFFRLQKSVQWEAHWGKPSEFSLKRAWVRWQQSNPQGLETQYGLRDSSLWLSGGLVASIPFSHWKIEPAVSSLSGYFHVRGARQEYSSERTILRSRTYWDHNRLEIFATPNHSPSNSRDFTIEELNMPYEQIESPRLQPTPHNPSGRIFVSHTKGTLSAPKENEESLWANRLFPAEIEEILGLSFYQKRFALWGSGDIYRSHAEFCLPFLRTPLQPWISGGAEYWKGTATFQLRTRTGHLFLEDQTIDTSHFDISSWLFLFSAGISGNLKASVKSSLSWHASLQQLVPLGLECTLNGASIQKDDPTQTSDFRLKSIGSRGFSARWGLLFSF